METRDHHHPSSNELILQQYSQAPPPGKNNSNNSSSNKRRFTDDQIRLLESIFESETKLEPKKKLQVARELGLQPRQVSIWFQNRRARLKSKQMEKDYVTLRDNYDKLVSRFEMLKEEKQCLISQMEKLSEMLAESETNGVNNKVSKVGSTEHEAEPGSSFKQEDDGVLGLETEKGHREIEDAVKHGDELMSMDEYRDYDDQFDHLCSRWQHWLNFWT
ncbi:hypothetical protein Godav_026243 [Gossypium davidsonii]|uniref:Homeobox-leucine zipper protein n=2 Tax=Gossypium TaxID=3633 RepID=A0A7J8RSB4_GOSDV|nr:hypothetical protein [Gossypium davidsonii]MBA0652010.1 hypothetical protein [Gossypium klotzschianum]